MQIKQKNEKRDANDTSSELIKIANRLLNIMNRNNQDTLLIEGILTNKNECLQFLSSDKDNPDINKVSEKLTKLHKEKNKNKDLSVHSLNNTVRSFMVSVMLLGF